MWGTMNPRLFWSQSFLLLSQIQSWLAVSSYKVTQLQATLPMALEAKNLIFVK